MIEGCNLEKFSSNFDKNQLTQLRQTVNRNDKPIDYYKSYDNIDKIIIRLLLHFKIHSC